MTISLFVYGSLRPGQCNYGQLADHVVSAETVFWPGTLYLRPEGYPALRLPDDWPVVSAPVYDWEPPPDQPAPRRSPDATPVAGEILSLRDTPALRRRLDDFEGFSLVPSDYVRVAVAWRGSWVWTYVAPVAAPGWPEISAWPPAGAAPSPWSERLR